MSGFTLPNPLDDANIQKAVTDSTLLANENRPSIFTLLVYCTTQTTKSFFTIKSTAE